jgi:hypothetical protein
MRVYTTQFIPLIPCENVGDKPGECEGHSHPEDLEEHVSNTRKVLAMNSKFAATTA